MIGTPERAFFYMDEMRALGIEPDDRTFLLLFRSCAEVRNTTILTEKLFHKNVYPNTHF